MFTIEGLAKQLATYAQQRLESQQMVHHLSGAMQVIEHQIGSLKTEALRIAEVEAKNLAEAEAQKLIDAGVPGAGEAVMDALLGASAPAQEG